MKGKELFSSTADKRLIGVCGLFCPACTVFIGTREDPERLKAIAKRHKRSVEELECTGCRSEKRCYYCESECKMTKCAGERGVEFCGQCAEYPCEDFKVFQAGMPHRIEVLKSQRRIKAEGYEKWYADMIEHYSCPKCRTLNSAYDLKCRNCGEEPSCAYVSRHKQSIVQQLEKWSENAAIRKGNFKKLLMSLGGLLVTAVIIFAESGIFERGQNLSMWDALFWLYFINYVLLSGYWMWNQLDLFRLGRNVDFVLFVVLFFFSLYGLTEVESNTFTGLMFSLVLSAIGIFAFLVYMFFIIKGRRGFAAPMSLFILILSLIISIAQMAITIHFLKL